MVVGSVVLVDVLLDLTVVVVDWDVGTVVVVGVVVVVEVVEGAVVVESTGVALLAKKPTITPETTPEPMKTDWVRRRTRAKRRSRCWGVRKGGLMGRTFESQSYGRF